jgi:hypothetical protein
MTRNNWAKGSGGPWYGIGRERILFEQGLWNAHPTAKVITSCRGMHAVRSYWLILAVPHFEPRGVEIRFAGPQRVPAPQVFSDGPRESPHRFDNDSLCMWFRGDPPHRRWLPSDGLVRLTDHIRLHLIKEAVWRETKEWLGPAVGHESMTDDGDDDN